MSENKISRIRNIAVVAHVDHGKTSLIDIFLKQQAKFTQDRTVIEERAMDSNALEKERGITILSKCTSISIPKNGTDYLIQILDTPGHADFGSEVERVLSMADGILLVVDAAEGIMPQSKFVVKKAIEKGLSIIVFINKIDKPTARIDEVQNEILELLMSYDENLLDVLIFYGAGREGFASDDIKIAEEMLSGKRERSMITLLEAIIDTIPAPKALEENCQMLVTMIDIDPFFGKRVIGKITGGSLEIGQSLVSVTEDGTIKERFRISKLSRYSGTKTEEITSAGVGEIVIIAGGDNVSINETLCSSNAILPLKGPVIDAPVMSITLGCNTSPYQGQEGTKLTSSMIKNRLHYEIETNPGLKLVDHGDTFEIFGRGELQLSILIENMRREGFELTVGAPKICITEINGVKHEPREQVIISVKSEDVGTVTTKLMRRGGEYVDMIEQDNRTKMIYNVTSRGLMGFRNEFLGDTKGDGLLSRAFFDLTPVQNQIITRINGVLIATEKGKATEYALNKLSERGIFFIAPGADVYDGMIIGENNQSNDLSVNVCAAKKLSNVRSAGKDEFSRLAPPKLMSTESILAYIQPDECIEITPKHIRLRKVKI